MWMYVVVEFRVSVIYYCSLFVWLKFRLRIKSIHLTIMCFTCYLKMRFSF